MPSRRIEASLRVRSDTARGAAEKTVEKREVCALRGLVWKIVFVIVTRDPAPTGGSRLPTSRR